MTNLLLPQTKLNATIEDVEKNWPDHFANPNERWVVTNVNSGDKAARPVLKFKLGSKPDAQPGIVDDNIYDFDPSQVTQHVSYDFNDLNEKAKAIYGFQEDSYDDEFALKIDEKPTKKKRLNINNKLKAIPKFSDPFCRLTDNRNSDLPKNGIESLLKASALTNKLMK